MADKVKCAAKLKKTMKWNIEQETLLINLVKAQEHLWNIKNNLYLNRTLKRTTYSEIAQVLTETFPESSEIFTVDEVMTKFSNLRTYFRTKYNQFKQPSGSGCIGIVPRWEHFFNLQFLGESLKPTKSSSNLESSFVDEENDADPHLKVDENAAEPNLKESDTSINDGSSATELQSPSVNKANRKRKRKSSNEIRQFALETLEELKNKEEDEDELYGQYIAKVLKSFDPVKKDLCKLEFQNVILKLRHNVHVE